MLWNAGPVLSVWSTGYITTVNGGLDVLTSISTLSVETLVAPVNHLTVVSSVDITTYPVAMALTLPDTNPTVWTAATWDTVSGQPYAAVVIGPGTALGTLAPGVYDCWVKVTASGETPIMRCSGKVNVYG